MTHEPEGNSLKTTTYVKSLKKDNKSVSYSLIMVNRQLLCSSFLCSQIRFTSHYKTLPFEVLEKKTGERENKVYIHTTRINLSRKHVAMTDKKRVLRKF